MVEPAQADVWNPAVPMVVGPGCDVVGGYACAPWADHALAPDNR